MRNFFDMMNIYLIRKITLKILFTILNDHSYVSPLSLGAYTSNLSLTSS